MDLRHSDEREMLRSGLDKFLASRYELERSRAATKTGTGWQPDVWRAFAEDLGILGAALPERVGGSGGGPLEIMVIAESLGRALVVEPYVDTAVVAAGLLLRAGGAAATEVVEQIIAGTAVVALAAAEEQAGDRWQDVTTTARRDEGGWVLRGQKTMAIGAPIATHLLVTAHTGDGVSLFLVDLGDVERGLEMHAMRTVDDRRAADLELTDLRLPHNALLGEQGQAWPSLAQARDEGAAAVCAEAVGAMRRVVADTVAYAKQRHQFGQPIAGFQALQHRMVDMYMELEQSAAAVHLAMLNLDADPPARARAVSAAKATIGRAARFVGQNAVQLHGGMGMTEELAIGHYFKRLTAVQYEYGTTDHHVTRYARLTTT
ncbi:acyl-CoA dehydrogenase family protein [Mycobacterium yunnanensis]|uniref:Acyl-CoA dehydrogenase family protein n=1 Tax=Mycobacterium yunnanensis TaxID=368477 RepID=A0A9X2ZDF1_9MYCO|nr:acyl-CoA dehydrogenase family protein [Mycobacterium yunnanensis]MCV7424802.1 acyl-CoA dehydrogenase family protein [Mycobacterium yunnanensis]